MRTDTEITMTMTMAPPNGVGGADGVGRRDGAMNVYRVGRASGGGVTAGSGGGWDGGVPGGAGARGAGGGGGDARLGAAGVVLMAKRRRSFAPPAVATYAWGMEPRKGGVRERFTATINAVDMAKVNCQLAYLLPLPLNAGLPCSIIYFFFRIFYVEYCLNGVAFVLP